jgi:3-oxoadipate enol-lactonase
MTVPRIVAAAPAGPPGAPLLVLGPSLGTSAILWDAAAARLRTVAGGAFRTVQWELPGHGTGPATREAFTVAELAEGVIHLLDELGETRVHFAGVSLGGAVGLELLLAHPDRVDAAAIVCSGAAIGTPAGWAERAATVRASGTPSVVVASASRWFAPDSMTHSPEITGRLLNSLRDADDESYALCCEALEGYDVRERLAEITVPVLAVWGEFDTVTPEASSAEIAAGVRHGRVAEVVGASHLAPAERPDAAARQLQDFFEEER